MPLYGPVLVAIDFSDAAGEALRQGQALAAAIGAPLIAGHVLPEAFRFRLLFPHQSGFDREQHIDLEEKARAAIRDRVEAVLGATDFSDPSLPAVRMAADEAARRGVPLRVTHCLDFDPIWNLAPIAAPGMIATAPLPQEVIDQFSATASEQLAAAIAATGQAGEPIVAYRTPGHGIVETAEAIAASLVVVGTHGRTGWSRLALGSVAEYVMGHAPVSVLTVPLNLS